MRDLDLLLALIDAAYNRRSWHGTNLRGSLRGVSARAAAWRPGRGRHNIWELAVHCAYWKYTARRRLLGEKRGSFALTGSNWFARSGPAHSTRSARSGQAEQQWRSDLALLDRMHAELRAATAALSSHDLAHTPRGSKYSNLALLSGVAAHDLYHAGQIQLLKRLRPGHW
jgi:hypothetical protein